MTEALKINLGVFATFLNVKKKQNVGWIISPDGSHAESVIPATARAQLGLGGGR